MFIKNDYILSNKNRVLAKIVDFDKKNELYSIKLINIEYKHEISISKQEIQKKFTLLDDDFSNTQKINKIELKCSCGWGNNVILSAHSHYCDFSVII